MPKERPPLDSFLIKEPEPDSENAGLTITRGAVQGAVLDPVEAIGQLWEHIRGGKLRFSPEEHAMLDKMGLVPKGGYRKWFDDIQRKTESTGLGEASRLVGALGSTVVAPEMAATRLAAAPRAVKAAVAIPQMGRRTAAARAGNAAIGAGTAMAAPAEQDDDNFAGTKVTQAGLGALLGALPGGRGAARGLGALAHHRYGASFPLHYGLVHALGPAGYFGTLGALAAMAGLQRMGPTAGRSLSAVAGEAVGQRKQPEEQNAE